MKLIIERGKTVPFDALPPWSIALDGYVQGPAFDNVRHRYSFDHHKGCIRLITTATCEQVRDAILLGLRPERFTAYLNDVDTDTALAVWALRNPERLIEARVGHLIGCAGLLDAHGGAYPLAHERRHLEWIGEPETEARISGRYEKLSTEELGQLLDEIAGRFELLLRGEVPRESELRAADARAEFTVLHRGENFAVVQAAHPHVLFDLYAQGIERVVTVRPLSDGSFAYTVAKKSDFVDEFDVPAILDALGEVEPGWGGGSTIGGAPRNSDGSRSRLTPSDVFELVEREVRRQKAESAKQGGEG
jgi:hypothetical protein